MTAAAGGSPRAPRPRPVSGSGDDAVAMPAASRMDTAVRVAAKSATTNPARTRLGAALGVWWVAARPRTLSAALVPVVVGTAVATRVGRFRPLIAALCLLGACLLQVAANLVNDWGDHARGADGPARRGPARSVQAGQIAPERMRRAALLVSGFAAVVGLALLAVSREWTVVAIGVASLLAAWAYTAGPRPLAYAGLGDVFVFLFFGPVAVVGAQALQSGRPAAVALAVSVPVGLLAVAILVVNNLRDVEGDRVVTKRTLVVRFGVRFGRALWLTCVGLAFLASALVALVWDAPAVLVTWATAPLALAPARLVLHETRPEVLDRALPATARLHLAFGLALAVGLVLVG